ncbi:VPLPA-CTERM sorting domain-containing protein [Frigidibacter sp. MR17.14]|uniref:VPLPA-CTERM sorting domain-containing protein n=1 Tax=Frigidibacter sp. MR17.14 TaxID=3126509 RepID=UPI003012A747
MKFTTLAAAGLAAVIAGGAAEAATIAPSVTYWSGTEVDGSVRSDTDNVNDGDTTDFLSLGLGGFAVFHVPGMFTGPSAVVEVTFNLIDPKLGPYTEAAQLYGGYSFDGSTLAGFTKLGDVITNAEAVGGAIVNFTGTYSWLAILDVTKSVFPKSPSNDGFDLASITVAPVPLPAGAVLMASGLAGLAALRRRKKAA